MIPYSRQANFIERNGELTVNSFITKEASNIDWDTVESFGQEWGKFHSFDSDEINRMGDQYFDIVPKSVLSKDSIVLDVGCGSGRWTKYIASKVNFIEAIDPSSSVFEAVSMNMTENNVRVSKASIDDMPFEDNTFDLVFSLGVLHHIPDTAEGIKRCVEKTKKGGHFLVYLYYNLDNRGLVFKTLFYLSNAIRFIVSKLPSALKHFSCELLAIFLYMPFVLFSRLLNKSIITRKLIRYIPLSYYHNKSFVVIRNDSLDRFGTPLENRFSRDVIKEMMTDAGLTDIVFSNNEPYWHALGYKK